MFVDSGLAIIVLAVALVVAAALIVGGRGKAPPPAPPEGAPAFELLRSSVEDLRVANAAALGDLWL